MNLMTLPSKSVAPSSVGSISQKERTKSGRFNLVSVSTTTTLLSLLKTKAEILSFRLNLMKKLLPVLLAATMVAPVQARESQAGFSNQCFREVYREEYIPGTMGNPGRVRSWTEQEEVPCRGERPVTMPAPEPSYRPSADDNSCIEGAVIGGIAGGGVGAALSRNEGNLIGIPLGIVGGALLGCQLDGG
jgi:hypothetical protein